MKLTRLCIRVLLSALVVMSCVVVVAGFSVPCVVVSAVVVAFPASGVVVVDVSAAVVVSLVDVVVTGMVVSEVVVVVFVSLLFVVVTGMVLSVVVSSSVFVGDLPSLSLRPSALGFSLEENTIRKLSVSHNEIHSLSILLLVKILSLFWIYIQSPKFFGTDSTAVRCPHHQYYRQCTKS